MDQLTQCAHCPAMLTTANAARDLHTILILTAHCAPAWRTWRDDTRTVRIVCHGDGSYTLHVHTPGPRHTTNVTPVHVPAGPHLTTVLTTATTLLTAGIARHA